MENLIQSPVSITVVDGRVPRLLEPSEMALTMNWLTHWGRDKMTVTLADDIFKCIFLKENVWISIKISLKFVPKVLISNIPALVQIMAWRRLGDKPLSGPIQCWHVHRRIYASLGLNELSSRHMWGLWARAGHPDMHKYLHPAVYSGM